MARMAMANLFQRRSSGVMVALLFALAGVGAAGSVGTKVNTQFSAGTEVAPMLTTLERKGAAYDEARGAEHGRRRRLVTAMVWCVAKSNLTDDMLQSSLDWVCGPEATQGQVNCVSVQSGQNCFLPDTVQTHASWAFNVYFQAHNATDDACNFQGTAWQVTQDPSTTTCVFAGSTKEINGTISNGTIATPPPPPPPGINFTNSAATAQVLFHVVTAVVVALLMTLLT